MFPSRLCRLLNQRLTTNNHKGDHHYIRNDYVLGLRRPADKWRDIYRGSGVSQKYKHDLMHTDSHALEPPQLTPRRMRKHRPSMFGGAGRECYISIKVRLRIIWDCNCVSSIIQSDQSKSMARARDWGVGGERHSLVNHCMERLTSEPAHQ